MRCQGYFLKKWSGDKIENIDDDDDDDDDDDEFFCGMIDRRKAFSLNSSRDHCQISDTL